MKRTYRVLWFVVSVIVVVTGCGLTFSYDTGIFRATVGDATSAAVKLDLSSHDTTIHALSDSSMLFDARLDYIGEIKFDVRGQVEKRVNLKEDSNNRYYAGIADLDWDIGLNAAIPLALMLDASSGKLAADLSTLTITSFDFEMGAGEAQIRLPRSGDAPMDARFDMGSGDVTVAIPDGTALDFDTLQMGSGDLLFEVGRDADFAVEVEMRSGTLIVDVPDDAAVQVTITEAGSGTFDRDIALTQVEHGALEGEGTWKTGNFDDANAHIVLSVQMDSGDLIVR